MKAETRHTDRRGRGREAAAGAGRTHGGGLRMSPRPIRVLTVINSLELGGAERMLERTVLALERTSRVRTTVCSLGAEGPIGRRLRSQGIEVVALGARDENVGAVVKGVLGLRSLFRVRRFDILHSFLYRSHVVARLARLSLGLTTPLVSSERCIGDNRSSLLLLANRLTSRWSDRILAVSEAVRGKAVTRDRIPASKVAIIRNGVEVPPLNPRAGARLRQALGISPADVVFLMLGRLHREKGPDVFLSALTHLDGQAAFRWRALFVGSGPEEESLVQWSKANGLAARVIFAGARGYVGPWLEACDMLVVPSREEGLPVAALEAMARRKPVVASRVGGTPEVVVEGETGLLVPPDDPLALARALTKLALEPHGRAMMGERGERRIRSRFSIDQMVDAILICYQGLVLDPEARGAAIAVDPALPVAGR